MKGARYVFGQIMFVDYELWTEIMLCMIKIGGDDFSKLLFIKTIEKIKITTTTP